MTALFHVAIILTAAATGSPLVLDETKQLFLDDFLIADMDNVTRTIHPAIKSPKDPVLWPEEPWEGKVAIVYGSVIRDGDRYRMWYHGGSGVSYAESKDGVIWTKPRFPFHPVDGQDTNILISRDAAEGDPNFIPYFYELFGVHKDETAADPGKRYVMGFLDIQRDYSGPDEDPFHKGQRRGLGVAASPDGIRWTLARSWATEAICDGGTHWMFDPASRKYVLYGRTKYVAPAVAETWADDPWAKQYFWGRSVARVESPDFLTWDYTKPASAPVVMTPDPQDPPGTEIYSMQVFPYESVYIGLVQVFHNQRDACYLDIELGVSHDGVDFTRVGDRTPFLPVGPVGSWDRFNTSVANNPPLAVGDTLRFYYGGRTYRHSPFSGPDKGESGGGIGFASIARDRFVSLNASFEGGVIETVPMQLSSDKLHMNASSRFGEVLVEVLDKTTRQRMAQSVPIRADELDIPITWANGERVDVSRAIFLRITLKNANLFALWCESGEIR